MSHMQNVINTLHAYSFRASTSVNLWNLESCKLSLEKFHILCPLSFHLHLLLLRSKNGSCFRNGFQGSDRHPCDTWPFSRRNASQHPGTKVTSHLEPATRCAKRSCESPHDHNGQWVPGLILVSPGSGAWKTSHTEELLDWIRVRSNQLMWVRFFSQMCPY